MKAFLQHTHTCIIHKISFIRIFAVFSLPSGDCDGRHSIKCSISFGAQTSKNAITVQSHLARRDMIDNMSGHEVNETTTFLGKAKFSTYGRKSDKFPGGNSMKGRLPLIAKIVFEVNLNRIFGDFK